MQPGTAGRIIQRHANLNSKLTCGVSIGATGPCSGARPRHARGVRRRSTWAAPGAIHVRGRGRARAAIDTRAAAGSARPAARPPARSAAAWPPSTDDGAPQPATAPHRPRSQHAHSRARLHALASRDKVRHRRTSQRARCPSSSPGPHALPSTLEFRSLVRRVNRP